MTGSNSASLLFPRGQRCLVLWLLPSAAWPDGAEWHHAPLLDVWERGLHALRLPRCHLQVPKGRWPSLLFPPPSLLFVWAVGPHEDLTIIKRRKLRWYGHVSCSSGLAKTILQSKVKGGRRQGRQRKRWEDNIRDWTGLVFAKSQRAMENRLKWRKLVAKSSVAPQRPWRLRDKWWWWWCFGEVYQLQSPFQKYTTSPQEKENY